MAQRKRAKWSLLEQRTAVQQAAASHELFLIKKRARKTADFWSIVGSLANHSGDETEALFRNLQVEYQRVRQRLHVSGAATDGPPMLRSSCELFVDFDNYYNLFFPHGGSAVPPFVMTESETTFMGISSQITNLSQSTNNNLLLGPTQTALRDNDQSLNQTSSENNNLLFDTFQLLNQTTETSSQNNLQGRTQRSEGFVSSQITDQSQSTSSVNNSALLGPVPLQTAFGTLQSLNPTSSQNNSLLLGPSLVNLQSRTRKSKGFVRGKASRRLTNNGYLVQSLACQTRALQLQRSQLRLENRRVDALEAIVSSQHCHAQALELIGSELHAIRSLFYAVNGAQVISPASCSDCNES